MPNFKSVVLFLLKDFGWWVTILGMVGDHPGDGGWPSMILHLVIILWVTSRCQTGLVFDNTVPVIIAFMPLLQICCNSYRKLITVKGFMEWTILHKSARCKKNQLCKLCNRRKRLLPQNAIFKILPSLTQTLTFVELGIDFVYPPPTPLGRVLPSLFVGL